MITPLEIQEKEFGRGLKGFKEEEVNEFLDQITLDLERLLAENDQLQMENQKLREELKKFQESEHSVINTLETAKALMNDISVSAEKRAQILLKNAELEAQTMMREAKETVARMNDEHTVLTNKLATFRRKYKELLEGELRNLEGSAAELFAELSMDDLSEIPVSQNAKPKQTATAFYAKQDLEKTIVNPK
jgi:cell division initiation protein